MKQKDTARKTIKEELKRNLIVFNENVLMKFGYSQRDIKGMLESENFSKALKWALDHPAVERKIEGIVERTFSPTNVVKEVRNFKKRLIAERAFANEMLLREILWKSNTKSVLHSKEARRNIIIQVFEKIKDAASGIQD